VAFAILDKQASTGTAMGNEQLFTPEMEDVIKRALAEDIGRGDVTTNSIVPESANLTAKLIAKGPGIIAGLAVAEAAFRWLDRRVRFKPIVAESDHVHAGETLAEIEGPARAILTAERTALNFVGRMSGIATLTWEFVNEVSQTKARILDTRKTAPNLRLFDKLAVRIGGGANHRMGLGDMILIKDNHIDFAGSIAEAVKRASAANAGLDVEVEARTLDDVAECLRAGVSWIMLDNMPLDEMRQAVALSAGRAKLEASGNVTLSNVRTIAETGVDYISIGVPTHSAQALDVSLVVNWRE
jgi:nicotinate-nucleotide pyrophosphorylase (carboxylating)